MKAIIHHRLIASGIMLLVSLMSCSKDGNTGNGSSGPSEPVTVDETRLRLYPAPEGADLSDRFTVTANGATVDVYQVKVAPEKDEDRWAAMDDPKNSHLYYSTAAFAYFDMNDAVQVSVTVPKKVSEEERELLMKLDSSAGSKTRKGRKGLKDKIQETIDDLTN